MLVTYDEKTLGKDREDQKVKEAENTNLKEQTRMAPTQSVAAKDATAKPKKKEDKIKEEEKRQIILHRRAKRLKQIKTLQKLFQKGPIPQKR